MTRPPLVRLGIRVRRERAEVALAALLPLLAGGAEETEPDQDEVEYAIYAPRAELPRADDIRALAGDALIDLTLTDVPEGWERRWHQYLRPVEVTAGGRRLRVRPPWAAAEEAAPAADLELVVDPGASFGAGSHATTQLCLELLLEMEPAGALCDWGVGQRRARRRGRAPGLGPGRRRGGGAGRAGHHPRERGGQRRRGAHALAQPRGHGAALGAHRARQPHRRAARADRRRRCWRARPSGWSPPACSPCARTRPRRPTRATACARPVAGSARSGPRCSWSGRDPAGRARRPRRRGGRAGGAARAGPGRPGGARARRRRRRVRALRRAGGAARRGRAAGRGGRRARRRVLGRAARRGLGGALEGVPRPRRRARPGGRRARAGAVGRARRRRRRPRDRARARLRHGRARHDAAVPGAPARPRAGRRVRRLGQRLRRAGRRGRAPGLRARGGLRRRPGRRRRHRARRGGQRRAGGRGRALRPAPRARPVGADGVRQPRAAAPARRRPRGCGARPRG